MKIWLTEFELAETALTRMNLLDVYLADVPLTKKFLTEFVMTRDCLPKQTQWEVVIMTQREQLEEVPYG
jgi:hypothetical protein